MPTTKIKPSFIASGSFTGSFLGTASYTTTASYALVAGSGGSGGGGSTQTGSIANQTILYNVTTSQDNIISGLNLSSNKWGVTVVEEWNSVSVPGDLYYNSSSLLLHFDGTNDSTTFTDNSPNNFTVTSTNGAKITSSISKFGGSSGFFDGTNDYLSVADSPALRVLAGDCTIETWFYAISTPPTIYGGPIFSKASSGGGWELRYTNTNRLSFVYPGVIGYDFGPNPVSLNTWYNVAIVKSGSIVKGYVNGTEYSIASSVPAETSQAFEIGSSGGRYGYFNGYIDELRVTKGVARYTGSFVTQSIGFPDNTSSIQYATKYIGLVGGLNDSTVDYGVEKLSDSSLKIRKMSSSGQPLSGSGTLSASVDRVYVNVLNYTNVSVGSTLLGQTFTALGSTSSYALSRSVINPYEIVVAVDGAVQSFNDAYSVTSSTINFTETIPSGSLVDIRYLTTPNVNSASYALTASYIIGGGGTSLTTGSTYPITSSWSNNSISSSYSNNTTSASYALSSSYALNSGTTLITGSTYPITSSWSNNSVSSSYSNISVSSSFATTSTSTTSASYSLSSSYSTTAANATSATNATNSTSASYSLTSSYSVNSSTAISSSFASTASYNLNSISSSYALTASYAMNGGTSLTTGSTYPITSSWSNNSLTASYALVAGSGGSSSSTSSLIGQTFVPTASINQLSLTQSVSNNDQILVILDGLVQSRTGSYTVTGSTLNLTENADSGSVIDVRFLAGSSLSSSFATTSSFAQNTAPRTAIYRYGTTSVVNPGSYAYTIIKYDTAVTDSTSWYDNTTGKFTSTVAGWYQVSAGARVYSSGGEGYLTLFKNGTEIASNGSVGCVNGFLSLLVYFNGSSDYIQIYSRTANAITNAQGSSNAPFTMVYITS